MCFSSSLTTAQNLLKRPKPSKIPSLLSAHAGIYIYSNVYNTSGHIYENLTKIPKSNISNILLNNTKKRWSGRASSLFSLLSLLSPLFSLLSPLFSLFEKCVPLLHETIHFCKNTESRTRGYVNNSRNLPTSRTQRTQGRNNSVQGNPSLRPDLS